MKTNLTNPNSKKMRGPNLTQFQYESEGWKRLLAFMLSENVYMKNRIAEVLRNNFDHSQLDDVESFQNNAIKMDDMVRILRNEIAEFDKLLIREIVEDGLILKEIVKKNKSVRNNVSYIETLFTKFKSEFNGYLTEYIES
jgi:hypothetical protein